MMKGTLADGSYGNVFFRRWWSPSISPWSEVMTISTSSIRSRTNWFSLPIWSSTKLTMP